MPCTLLRLHPGQHLPASGRTQVLLRSGPNEDPARTEVGWKGGVQELSTAEAVSRGSAAKCIQRATGADKYAMLSVQLSFMPSMGRES